MRGAAPPVLLAAALLAAALPAAGCLSFKRGLDLPDPAGLRAGVTTREEVYARFGLPAEVLDRAGGTALLYEVDGGRGYSVGVGWRTVTLSTMETEFTRSALEIRLDASDRVAGARWTDGEGRGRSLGSE